MDDDVTDITGDPGTPDACYIAEDSRTGAVAANDGGVKTWVWTGNTGRGVRARQILMQQAGRAVHRHPVVLADPTIGAGRISRARRPDITREEKCRWASMTNCLTTRRHLLEQRTNGR